MVPASIVVVCVEGSCTVIVDFSLAGATGVTSIVVVAVTRVGPSGAPVVAVCARPSEAEDDGAE